jgi:hypothetical protein
MGRSISDIATEITKLGRAHKAGELSDTAHDAAKAALLAEMSAASGAAKAAADPERPPTAESTETVDDRDPGSGGPSMSDLFDGGDEDELAKKLKFGWWTVNLGAEESAAPYHATRIGFVILFGLQWAYSKYGEGTSGFTHLLYMVGIFLAIQFASWVVKDAHDVVRRVAPGHFVSLVPSWLWGLGVALMCCVGAPVYLGLRLHVAVAHGGGRALEGKVWNSYALGLVLFAFAAGVGMFGPAVDMFQGEAYIEWECVPTQSALQCNFSNTGSGAGHVCLDAVMVCGDGRHTAHHCSNELEAGFYESQVITGFSPPLRTFYGCAIEYENAIAQ